MSHGSFSVYFFPFGSLKKIILFNQYFNTSQVFFFCERAGHQIYQVFYFTPGTQGASPRVWKTKDVAQSTQQPTGRMDQMSHLPRTYLFQPAKNGQTLGPKRP